MDNTSNKLSFTVDIVVEGEYTEAELDKIRDEIFWKLNNATEALNVNHTATVKKI